MRSAGAVHRACTGIHPRQDRGAAAAAQHAIIADAPDRRNESGGRIHWTRVWDWVCRLSGLFTLVKDDPRGPNGTVGPDVPRVYGWDRVKRSRDAWHHRGAAIQNDPMSLWRTAYRTLLSIEAIPLVTLYALCLLVLPISNTALPVIGRE